jgi:hypothetical protein
MIPDIELQSSITGRWLSSPTSFKYDSVNMPGWYYVVDMTVKQTNESVDGSGYITMSPNNDMSYPQYSYALYISGTNIDSVISLKIDSPYSQGMQFTGRLLSDSSINGHMTIKDYSFETIILHRQ